MWRGNSIQPQLDDAGTHLIRPTLDHCIKHLSTSFIVIESVNAPVFIYLTNTPFFLTTHLRCVNILENKLFKKTKFLLSERPTTRNFLARVRRFIYQTDNLLLKNFQTYPKSFPLFIIIITITNPNCFLLCFFLSRKSSYINPILYEQKSKKSNPE